MNPAKMRNTYGKLMYILMDTQSHVIKSELKVTWVKPIKTVYNFFERKKCVGILHDPLWEQATISISNEGNELSQSEIAKLQEGKKAAVAALMKKYVTGRTFCVYFDLCIEYMCGYRVADCSGHPAHH